MNLLKAKNITLENVKKSNYWKLISILVWSHYSEKKYQEEEKIEIYESWYGKAKGGSSHNSCWDDPEYSEEGYVRTLGSIVIKFKRSDYDTYIYIHTHGNISCFGIYRDKREKSLNYLGAQRNLEITNWLIENNFIEIKK